MSDFAQRFANFYTGIVDRWSQSGKNLSVFTEDEQETIALYDFNSNYGGNGLADYVSFSGREMLAVTLRSLFRIGANRLAAIVQEYFALLADYGFDFDDSDDDVYRFIERWPSSVQNRFDALQAEAAELYSDFYQRWESHFAFHVADVTHHPEA